jgi:cob(I)alamin adenosyltransferase
MKIYTKGGDAGTTSLYDGGRALKSIPNFQVIGEMDELSARIGMLCASTPSIAKKNILGRHLSDILREIQRVLQDLNSYVAVTKSTKKRLPSVSEATVSILEEVIDAMEEELPKLTKFILPGVTIADSHAHLCRTQTRKVERQLVELINKEDSGWECEYSDMMGSYLNRLSDFFFVLARWICYEEGEDDCFYDPK